MCVIRLIDVAHQWCRRTPHVTFCPNLVLLEFSLSQASSRAFPSNTEADTAPRNMTHAELHKVHLQNVKRLSTEPDYCSPNMLKEIPFLSNKNLYLFYFCQTIIDICSICKTN